MVFGKTGFICYFTYIYRGSIVVVDKKFRFNNSSV